MGCVRCSVCRCVGVSVFRRGCLVREHSLWVLHVVSSPSVSFTIFTCLSHHFFSPPLFVSLALSHYLLPSHPPFPLPPHTPPFSPPPPSSLVQGTKHRPRIFLRPVPPRGTRYHSRRHRAAHRHQPRFRYERVRGPTGASAHQGCGRPRPRGVPGARARECVLKRLGRRRRSDSYGRCQRHHRCGGERYFGPWR